MKVNEKGKYEPDFSSRYFIEDFPYGMRFIVDTARKYNVNTPSKARQITDKVFWDVK